MIGMGQRGTGRGFCRYSGQGIIKLLILRILHEKSSHGYQIIDELERITSKKYNPEPGAIYTMLRRMDKHGLVTSKWEKKKTGVDRRVYTLAETGVKTLREGLEMLKQRRQLFDSLVQYHDANFVEKKKRGNVEFDKSI